MDNESDNIEINRALIAKVKVIAHVDTALGCIPVAMGRDVFDLSALDVGSIIGMNADVKVDLSSSDDFTIVSTDTE